MEDDELKESFLRLSKSIIDPEEEKSEYDLGIEFEEEESLTLEEEEELRKRKEDVIDEVSKGLFFEEE